MTDAVKVGFVPFSTPARGLMVVFCDEALKFGAATGKALGKASDRRGTGAQPLEHPAARRIGQGFKGISVSHNLP